MSWGYGVLDDGREIGYNVAAKCDAGGCETDIDRGLAYVCGGMHEGGELGCGGYFCYSHLFMGRGAQLCSSCFKKAGRRKRRGV
jgi:hypothetical protein